MTNGRRKRNDMFRRMDIIHFLTDSLFSKWIYRMDYKMQEGDRTMSKELYCVHCNSDTTHWAKLTKKVWYCEDCLEEREE